MYVSKSYDPNHPLKYAITMKDHSPNTLFIKNKHSKGHFKQFVEMYKQGNVRFEDMNIKNITYEVIQMCYS